MLKKSLAVLTVAAAFFVKAQDVSTIKNTSGIYSDSSLPGSAKYNAMAGSMGALGGDVSVLNSNPAGLGVYITSDLSGTLSVMGSKNTTTLGGASLDYKINDTNLGQVGGVASFSVPGNTAWKFVNIGVNYSSRSIADYSETPGANISLAGSDTSGQDYSFNFLRHAYDRTGTQSKMSFGVGANYNNRIYLGAGLHFHTVNIDQSDIAEFSDATNTSAVFDKQYTPFSEQSNGFSANIGIIGKISNEFRLGAALETPTWWTVSRAYNYYGEQNSEDRKLTSPMKATISAAFVPSKDFSLNVDYSLGITKPKYQVYGDAETELNSFFSSNYKNLSEIKAGAEYRINGFRLRSGYGYATSPFNSTGLTAYNDSGMTGSTSYSDLFAGSRTTIGAGIGYDFKSFYVDAAYQNISTTYHDPFLQGASADGSGNGYVFGDYATNSDAYAVSTVKNSKNNFFLTLGWKF